MFYLLYFVFIFASADFLKPQDFEKDTSGTKALVFLSQACPCSNSHIEHLGELQKKFPQVPIYGVITDRRGRDEERSRVDSYFLDPKIKIRIIEDAEMTLVKNYGALKTPHVTLLTKDSKGIYQKVYEGGVTNDRHFESATIKYLQENLEMLSAKNIVKHTTGHSLGCYIRRL